MDSRPVSALDPFLDVLRGNRFPTGPDHRLRLIQALDSWQGEYPPQRLRTLLCPIFATNAEEQRRFYDLFDRHFPHFGNAALAVPDGDPGSAVVIPITRDPERRLARWLLALFPVLAVVVVIFAAWNFGDPGGPPSPKPVPAPSWSLRKPYQPSATLEPPPKNPRLKPATKLPSAVNPAQTSAAWRWSGLLLIPVFAWALVEVWAWRRRQVLLARGASEPLTGSPFVRVALPVRAAAQAGFAATLRRLRHPTAGPLRLHLGKTVTATIRATGFPAFRFEPVFRRPEYLVLIGRMAIRDHQATLFEELVAALDRRGLRVAVYAFSGDPRVCRHIKTGRNVYLADLFFRTSDHRLIVFGDGDRLVSDSDWGELTSAGSVLVRWRQRVILTPLGPDDWGRRELSLARHFLLLPATSAALAASVDHFDPDHSARLRRPVSGFDHREPDLDRATASEIRRFLGDDDLYRRLCACALYPQLQWDVTLQLGAKLGADLLNEGNLGKLVRLPWFRRGSIPVSLQQALAESLDTSTRSQLRAAILELFEETRPGADGPAADAHRLEIAIQRLDILPEERRRILEDETVARVVAGEDPPSGLLASPALRQALFPHGVPTFGFRSGARRGLAVFAGFAMACIAGSGWYFHHQGLNLSRAHAELSYDTCHSGLARVQDERCFPCHSESKATAVHEQNRVRCTDCHSEHRGPEFDIARDVGSGCQAAGCHVNVHAKEKRVLAGKAPPQLGLTVAVAFAAPFGRAQPGDRMHDKHNDLAEGCAYR